MHKITKNNATNVSKIPKPVLQPNVPTQNRYIQQIIRSTNPLCLHITSAYFVAMSISFLSIPDIFNLSPP